MTSPAGFLDTNVVVYAFIHDPRAERARSLLAEGCAIGVQTLNEFVNIARRELGMDWAEAGQAVAAVRRLCPLVVPLTLDIHAAALLIAPRYGLALFDSLMLAAALDGGCAMFWSKDMHDGLIIDGRLRIANPFLRA